MRAVQIPSTATLIPVPEESVEWETTQNVFIEGENLEVLKMPQKSYQSKVKMICIDPPYNTGNDFIYPDNYRDSIGNYLRLTGQVSSAGIKLTTNAETSGRYHSNWLNMMYPRLFLGRNLLREDGIVFVSIDDHEVENLRCMMDEIFGEENFVATVIWQKKYSTKADSKYFSESHEYLVVYARNLANLRIFGLKRTEEQENIYKNPDNDPRGVWTSDNLLRTEERDYAIFEIVGPRGQRCMPPKGSSWRFTKDKIQELIDDNRIWFGEKGDSKPRLKRFRADVRESVPPQTIWTFDQVGHTDEGTKELASLFGGTESPFPNPKTVRLVLRMLAISCSADDLVLDFFAGSGTTAQAVLEMNNKDGGDRRFILVQIPEPTAREDYATIAGITKERIRRVIHNLNHAEADQLPLDGREKRERGFRVFKLGESNFKVWNADYQLSNASALTEQLRLHTDHVLPDRSQQDILFELLLKAGYPLTASISEVGVAEQVAFSISDGNLIVCLEWAIAIETLRAIMDLKPKPVQVICLDHAFQGNDQLKTNIVLEMESRDIQFRTV